MTQLALGFGDGLRRVAGIDEAGRGPLAGPVVAAAVVLPAAGLPGIADSKQLTAKRREELAQLIRLRAVAWGIGRAEVEEIDRLNILQATFLAMRRALEGVTPAPELALVDGRQCPPLPCPAEPVIGGDATVPAIGAASILAKVARDAEMAAMEERYPGYGFAQHKGYGTAAHRRALRRLGTCPIHRRSFRPVRELVDETTA